MCSAGLLRSPTSAFVLSQSPYDLNTRAVGVDDGHALIALDAVQLVWSDIIVWAERGHYDIGKSVERRIYAEANGVGQNEIDDDKLIINNRPNYILNIPDRYAYRECALIAEIKDRFDYAKKLANKEMLANFVIEVPKTLP